ncbi:hypothetical protein POX_g08960 [Penicillium oxalicum]|uniref:hypothetical protein n=1 Tax=Penicillium oxalicum TaxID=69781 RepID=UPI0020B7B858|nr:hypothetical protein POX_g08960 [Penicillium oxalicum]KAI2786574.1 hypothetical protein POX_g08960 [Penicillium oxalicum]
MPEIDVLIAGAGPTGLVLALWLHHQGVKVRIIDQSTGPAPDSRALVVHARILELYRQLDLADEMVQRGYQIPATNVWVNGVRRAHIPLKEFGSELTPYPCMFTLPQNVHEGLLEKRLNSNGVFVERRTKLKGFTDDGTTVSATLQNDDGEEETCEAGYLVGCDGAHSVVRHGIGANYEGETYIPLFYIADMVAGEQESPMSNGEAHITFVDDTFNLVLPFVEERRVRLIGTIMAKDDGTSHVSSAYSHTAVTFEDVLPDIKKASRINVEKVNWFSTYRSHHRVSDKFRSKRAFIVGDAAHIHSPVGGQGMNTGIMDAINLAWKLATVIKQSSMTEEARNALLDTFESERRPFALNIVGATDQGFTTLTSSSYLAHMMRNWIIPYVAPFVMRLQRVRNEAFKRGSQLVCSYRGNSTLNQRGDASAIIQPGDRLPWVKTNTCDNFSSLKSLSWQVHVYGLPDVNLRKWCEDKHISLFVFEWNTKHSSAGFKKDAAYLLRPDQYIAGIFEGESLGSQLEQYFLERGLAV